MGNGGVECNLAGRSWPIAHICDWGMIIGDGQSLGERRSKLGELRNLEGFRGILQVFFNGEFNRDFSSRNVLDD